jgi:hypothetical protein
MNWLVDGQTWTWAVRHSRTPLTHGLVGFLAQPSLTIDMVIQKQQNLTSPLIVLGRLTQPNLTLDRVSYTVQHRVDIFNLSIG